LESIISAGTPAITRTDFCYSDGATDSVAIRQEPGRPGLYAPRRTVLDGLLAQAAIAAGADFRFGTTVVDLLRAERTIIGVTWRERASGAVRTAHAPMVIGADGRRSTVADLVGARYRRVGAAAGAIVLGYYSGLDQHTYQWFYAPGGSVGVVPTNDGLACVWAGASTAAFAARNTGHEEFQRTLLAVNAPGLRLPDSTSHGPVRAYPGQAGFVRQAAGAGWALVGDAGYFKDPITAHGITDALRDAELLARAVVLMLDGDRTALRHYERVRDQLSAPVWELTERIAGYRWDLAEIRELLPALSRAMRPEVAALQALEPLEHLSAARAG
jgi:flavin-dependent dehydrogenase